MHHLTLPGGICAPAVRLCHITVHIPFDVGNGRFTENLCDHFVDIIYHFFSGEVKYMLMPCMGLKAVRCTDEPVRMCPVKVTVLVHHRQFFKVYIPVSKPSIVIVSGAKPSVIQNKQFHTGLFCLLSYL